MFNPVKGFEESRLSVDLVFQVYKLSTCVFLQAYPRISDEVISCISDKLNGGPIRLDP